MPRISSPESGVFSCDRALQAFAARDREPAIPESGRFHGAHGDGVEDGIPVVEALHAHRVDGGELQERAFADHEDHALAAAEHAGHVAGCHVRSRDRGICRDAIANDVIGAGLGRTEKRGFHASLKFGNAGMHAHLANRSAQALELGPASRVEEGQVEPGQVGIEHGASAHGVEFAEEAARAQDAADRRAGVGPGEGRPVRVAVPGSSHGSRLVEPLRGETPVGVQVAVPDAQRANGEKSR